MRSLDCLWGLFARLKSAVGTHQRLLRFRCGDCERSDRCGLQPSADCIARATQIEQDGDQPRPRPDVQAFG